MKNTTVLIAFLTGLALAACNAPVESASPIDPNRMVAAGETTRDPGKLRFPESSGGNGQSIEEGSPRGPLPCQHLTTRGKGSVVLGQVVGEMTYSHSDGLFCPGRYTSSAWEFEFETWGVAWGEEVPARFKAVAIIDWETHGELGSGRMFLMTVRFLDGVGIAFRVTPLLPPEQRSSTYPALPETFEGVVALLDEYGEAYDRKCPIEAASAEMDDDELRRRIYNDEETASRPCIEPEPEPERRRPCEEADPPPCCFDDSLPGCD